MGNRGGGGGGGGRVIKVIGGGEGQGVRIPRPTWE